MDAPAPLHVRAPATSANLGPAFDAAGIALDWWDELEVRPAPADAIHLSGEQAELLPTGRDNLVAAAMRRLAVAAGAALPPLHLSPSSSAWSRPAAWSPPSSPRPSCWPWPASWRATPTTPPPACRAGPP
jgi:hypothetical protein